MRRSSFYKFLILVIIMSSTISLSAQQVDEKLPWSVRMTESEMIRCPESWQLDFQPRLKWDYCHGLELGAMLDVYDTYGDKKYGIMQLLMQIRWCMWMEVLLHTN